VGNWKGGSSATVRWAGMIELGHNNMGNMGNIVDGVVDLEVLGES
jgi:hypothetical protein